jgi:hypothetical protein
MKHFRVCEQTIRCFKGGGFLLESKAIANRDETQVKAEYLDIPLYGERVISGDQDANCFYITRTA